MRNERVTSWKWFTANIAFVLFNCSWFIWVAGTTSDPGAWPMMVRYCWERRLSKWQRCSCWWWLHNILYGKISRLFSFFDLFFFFLLRLSVFYIYFWFWVCGCLVIFRIVRYIATINNIRMKSQSKGIIISEWRMKKRNEGCIGNTWFNLLRRWKIEGGFIAPNCLEKTIRNGIKEIATTIVKNSMLKWRNINFRHASEDESV